MKVEIRFANEASGEQVGSAVLAIRTADPRGVFDSNTRTLKATILNLNEQGLQTMFPCIESIQEVDEPLQTGWDFNLEG